MKLIIRNKVFIILVYIVLVFCLMLSVSIRLFIRLEHKSSKKQSTPITQNIASNKSLLAQKEGDGQKPLTVFEKNDFYARNELQKAEQLYNKSAMEILGSSSKFTNGQIQSNQSWKNEVLRFANDYKDVFKLNGSQFKKSVALTFDDGPDLVATPKILDILKRYHITASFFFVGNRVSMYSNVVKRTFDEGNIVLNHTFSHADIKGMNNTRLDEEIKKTNTALFKIIGKTPAILRPPYGSIDENGINHISQMKMTICMWSIDTFDWSVMVKESIAQNVLDNVRSGDVILMHSNENKIATYEALPLIIEGLIDRGYSISGLNEVLSEKAYMED